MKIYILLLAFINFIMSKHLTHFIKNRNTNLSSHYLKINCHDCVPKKLKCVLREEFTCKNYTSETNCLLNLAVCKWRFGKCERKINKCDKACMIQFFMGSGDKICVKRG